MLTLKLLGFCFSAVNVRQWSYSIFVDKARKCSRSKDHKGIQPWSNDTGKHMCTSTLHCFAESGPNVMQYLAKVHYCTLLGWKFPHKCLDNNWAHTKSQGERQNVPWRYTEDICIWVFILCETNSFRQHFPPSLPPSSFCIWKLDIPMEKLDCCYEPP